MRGVIVVKQLDMFTMSKTSPRPAFPYFGGKQKARRDILRCFPKGLDFLVSPFLGGGSVELYAASRGIQVRGFDKFEPLCRLWNALLEDAESVARITHEQYPYSAKFLRDEVMNGTYAMYIEDDFEFASVAWAMSQQAYGGLFMNGTYFDCKVKTKGTGNIKACASIDYFLPSRWRDWGNENLKVGCQSWELTLEQFPDAFLYVDPPYVGNEKYYGANKNKDDFDHVGLAETLRNHNNGWVISYVEHPLLDELYGDFEIIHPRWHQGTIAAAQKLRKDDGERRHSKSAKEVYILKPPARHPFESIQMV